MAAGHLAVQQRGGQQQRRQGGQPPDGDEPRGRGAVRLDGQGAQHTDQPQYVGGQREVRQLEGGEGIAHGVLPEDDRQDEAEHRQGARGVPGHEQTARGEQGAERRRDEPR